MDLDFNFVKTFYILFADAVKISVITALTAIALVVLLNILPLIHATVISVIICIVFVIFPIANYIIMFMAVRYHNRKVQDMVSSLQLQVILRREKKVAMNMFIVFVVFAICVIPKYASLILSQSFGSLYPSIYLLSTTLMMLNSSINPILYIWRDSGLRATLKSYVNI